MDRRLHSPDNQQHTRDILIPRKPVPSQSSHNASPSVEEARYRSGTTASLRHTANDRGSSRTADRESHSASWRASDQSTLVHEDTGIVLRESAQPDGQQEHLLQLPQGRPPINNIEASVLSWLPNTLKKPYLLALILVSSGLSVTVGILTWYSTVHTGLGNDSNSTLLLFGWRFTPTLVAVLYVLLETMLLVDVRRTEAFARLARNDTSSASTTLLHTADSWWNDPREALRKQGKTGWRSWALLWASVANMVGVFVISPLSAGLLSPEYIEITRDTTFQKISAFRDLPLQATVNDATYVRSIASLTIGLTTSAWLNEEYGILPFWPSGHDAVPLGALLAPTSQTWHGKTTAFQVSMDCEAMWLSEAGYRPAMTIEPAPYKLDSPFYVDAYTSLQMTSADGCIYEFAVSDPENVDFFDVGGGWWSNTSGTNYPSSANTGYVPTLVVDSSSQCDDREVLFVTTPFRNSSTFATGYVCSSIYYQADVETSVTTSSSQTSVSSDTEAFQQLKRPMSADFDIVSFEQIFLGSQWLTKLQPPGQTSDMRARFGGPLLPIATLYDNNIQQMMANASVLGQAKVTKQRFLGEALLNTFSSIGSQNAESIPGHFTQLEHRVLVSFAIGVTLAALLFLSAIMFVDVLYHSRLNRRPLGLTRDPASAAATSALIAEDEDSRGCLEGQDRASRETMVMLLKHTFFRLRAGTIRAVEKPTKREHQLGTCSALFENSNIQSV